MVENYSYKFPLEIFFYSIIMEDCTICYLKTNKWKVLPCQHKLCKKCYIQLRQATCPYCRSEFTYTKEEQIKRHNMYINNRNHPPTQLRSNNTINIEEYTNYNAPNSRIETSKVPPPKS